MASRDDMSKHDGSALCVATAVAPPEISWEKRSRQICRRFTSEKSIVIFQVKNSYSAKQANIIVLPFKHV